MSGYSNNQSNPYEDEEPQGDTGKGLRAQLEQVLAELAELKKASKPKAADVLKDNGLDPALEAIIPTDEDPKEWVEKYAHLLGVKPKEQSEEKKVEEEPLEVFMQEDEDPALTLEREAIESMHGAQQAGSPSIVQSDVLEKMNAINSEEELLKFFQNNGG